MTDRDSGGRFEGGHASPGPGRPSLYRDEYAEQARKFCLLGATNDRLAELFEVHLSTIHEWMNVHDAFSEGVKTGRDIADAEIAESLFHRARGYEHDAIHFSAYEGCVTETPYTKHYPPDTAAATLWLKNRQPALWRDKHVVEHTGRLAVIDESMSYEEAERIYTANLKDGRDDG